jgi:hypothetical protein
MIDGQPNRNEPTTVAAPNAPMASPIACRPYTMCRVRTRAPSMSLTMTVLSVLMGLSPRDRR